MNQDFSRATDVAKEPRTTRTPDLRHVTASLTIVVRGANNPANAGWILRMNGAKVLTRPLRFGVSRVVVKEHGDAVCFDQDSNRTMTALIRNPTDVQRRIVERLCETGVVSECVPS